MRDVLPPESAKWQFIEQTARRILECHGYREARTPILEYTPLFARSIGEATDIVEKEMYTFADRDGRSVTMRPEGTASVVRAYLERGASQDPITKWHYLGPMFRHERPQRGRLRQFHQIGAEALGVDAPTIDAELVAMCWRIVERIGVGAPALRLSSLGCATCRGAFRAALVAFLAPRAPLLCEDCGRRIEQNPLRVLDCKKPECAAAREGAPSTLDVLCDACRGHFETLCGDLDALGVPYAVDRALVRGLDYYTRTTFEITSAADGVGAQNAILGGGRYDRLVEELGGPAVPAIGFAMGVERAALAIPGDDATYVDPIDAFVVAIGEGARRWSLAAADRLRRGGLAVELDHRGGSVKSQMRRADKLGARIVIVAGDDELARQAAKLKVMSTGEQREVAEGELLSAIRHALGHGGG
ncbi:MAG: histidine--tRNA ligase [Myxococcota bacterium]